MNYVELGIWVITGIALVFSIIMGLVRGSRRATLRLVLILLCAVVTFLLKDYVTNMILNTTVTESGVQMTLQEYVLSILPEEMAELGESVVIPLVKVIVGVVVFVVLFWALKLVSWMILYPICKLFVKKGEKKHAGFGGLIGLVQGVAIALCFCVPLSGLVVQVNRVIPMMDQLGSAETMSVEASEGEGSSDGAIISEDVQQMLVDFEQGPIGSFYGKTCAPLFDFICSVKIEAEDGTNRNVTLSGQIDALQAMLDIVKEFNEASEQLSELNFSDLSSLSDLKQTFEKLDDITGDLSDEAKSTINSVVSAAIDMISAPEDAEDSVKELVEEMKDVLKETDFTEIKFSKELDIIEDLADTLEKGTDITSEDISATINSVSESALLIPVLESMDTTLELEDATKAHLEEVFADLPADTNQETVDLLKKLLGLTTVEE